MCIRDRTETDLLKIKAMDVPGFKVVTLSICYYKNTDLEKAIDRLFVDVDRAYRDGANILILSDRDIDEYHVAIPSLLAVGAVSKLSLIHISIRFGPAWPPCRSPAP